MNALFSDRFVIFDQVFVKQFKKRVNYDDYDLGITADDFLFYSKNKKYLMFIRAKMFPVNR